MTGIRWHCGLPARSLAARMSGMRRPQLRRRSLLQPPPLCIGRVALAALDANQTPPVCPTHCHPGQAKREPGSTKMSALLRSRIRLRLCRSSRNGACAVSGILINRSAYFLQIPASRGRDDALGKSAEFAWPRFWRGCLVATPRPRRRDKVRASVGGYAAILNISAFRGSSATLPASWAPRIALTKSATAWESCPVTSDR